MNAEVSVNEVGRINLYETYFYYYFHEKRYAEAFFIILQWLDITVSNRARLFNIFFYLRMVLSKLHEMEKKRGDLLSKIMNQPISHRLSKEIPHQLITGETPYKLLYGKMQKLLGIEPDLTNRSFRFLIDALDRYFSTIKERALSGSYEKTQEFRNIESLMRFESTFKDEQEENTPHSSGGVIFSNSILSNLLTTYFRFQDKLEFLNIKYKNYTRTIVFVFFHYFRYYDRLFLKGNRLLDKYPLFLPDYIIRMALGQPQN